MTQEFKSVIFDLDGTLINSIPDIADSMNCILNRYGYPEYSYEEYRFFLGKGIRHLVELCIPPQYATNENIEQIYTAMVEEYSNNCVNKTTVYEGIYELLDALLTKNIKLAVLSNKADDITQKICKTLFDSQFEQILGATDGFPKKPAPESALYLASRLGINPKNVFYLGDTHIDMKTAQVAGFFPAGAAWGFRGAEELAAAGASFIADKPTDCLRFLGHK